MTTEPTIHLVWGATGDGGQHRASPADAAALRDGLAEPIGYDRGGQIDDLPVDWVRIRPGQAVQILDAYARTGTRPDQPGWTALS